MFLNIKLKAVIAFILSLALSFATSIFIYRSINATTTPKLNYTIVLDAGHGARDAGCSGVNTGAKESDINLEITLKLKTYLENFGFNVVLTRKDDSPLYSANAKNCKKEDMEKREQIIKEAKADLVISIHQNSFPELTEKGAQCFFNPENESSYKLSNCIQTQLIKQIENARKAPNKGDYYILNITNDLPISIVECGFLTNPDEEVLLCDSTYQNKLAYAIMCGIVDYFGIENTSSQLNDYYTC